MFLTQKKISNVPLSPLKKVRYRTGTPAERFGRKNMTAKEKWLDKMGGRTSEDVFKDKQGEYVLMVGERSAIRNLKEKQKVYLPSLQELKARYT